MASVTTNNFNEVLRHFDENGHIADGNTRINIECGICKEKHLAILNPRFDSRSRDAHESYAVLPKCSHAFGYACIHTWMTGHVWTAPTCPTCRQQIFLEQEPRIMGIFGDSGFEGQHLDVIEIRESLRRAQAAGVEAPPQPEQQPQPQPQPNAPPQHPVDLSRVPYNPQRVMETYLSMRRGERTRAEFVEAERQRVDEMINFFNFIRGTLESGDAVDPLLRMA